MLKGASAWLKRRIQGRIFEAIQIEVTSRCSNRCVMCPRVVLAGEWREMDLPWETFERIAHAFPRARHVHLQGWGEPLLHPHLFDMVARAKAAGCQVGLTTNGALLSPGVATQLLDHRLDLLSVSIAGATRETHEAIRVGSNFSVILENLRHLLALRRRWPGPRPKVELSYLMTRTNMAELPKAVEMARTLGVEELYAINLDYIVTPEHDALRAFDCPSLREAFAQHVQEARDKADRASIAFRPYPLNREEVAVCEARPTKILFISCDGWVSPCPYMALAGWAEIPRYFDGQSVRVPRLRFGNIEAQELMEIWRSPAYRAFRRQFERRLTAAMALAVGVETGSGGTYHAGTPPPPEPCRTCYKLYGV